MSAEILAEVVNEAMELLGLPPGSTDEQFLDAIRTVREDGFEAGRLHASIEALPIAFADCEALVVAMLEEMAAAERQNDNWSGGVVLTGAALAVSLGQHRSAEVNERAIVAAHREAAGFNSSKAGGEARSRALSPAKRKKIATKAARARWAAKKGE